MACGKMGPRQARRQGSTQEWEWHYQVCAEEVVDESMLEMNLRVHMFEA